MKSKLILSYLILFLFIISCGTETDTELLKWDGSWKVMGLEEQTTRYIDASDTYLFAASAEEVYRQPVGENIRIWDGLGFSVIESTEVGLWHFIYTNQQLFAIYPSDDDKNLSPLFRSSDNGQSWENVEITIEGQEAPYSINSITSPKNTSVLYAQFGYAYRSEDEGNNWDLISDHFVAADGLYISEDYPNQIWGYGRTTIGTGVLNVSRDYGETWENLSENINISFNCCGINAVIVPSEDENMVLAGFGGSIKKSEDGGDSWETVMNGFVVESFLNSLSVPGRIYATGRLVGERRIFVAVSEDRGDTWEIREYPDSPPESSVYDATLVEENGEEVIYLATNRGVYGFRMQ